MDNMKSELIHSHSNQLWMLQEAVMQLLEQLVAPNPDAASAFEAGMRARTNALLEEEDHGDQLAEVTLLLSALLASAGKPPQRG